MTVDTLCNNHNNIIYELDCIIKYCKRTNKDEVIINKLTELKSMAKKCKKQGQHMENRLKLYRNSIEKLGFKRIGGRETI